jgi:hypothetical protein
MRLIVRFIARSTLLLLVLLAFAISQQPSSAFAKTVLPVEFGDPTDTTQGPAPGSGKGSTKDSASRVVVPTEGIPLPHSGMRFLLAQDRYFLAVSILRCMWR